ncbi:MAG: agmatinase [Acidimicrobiales bacterium]
MDGTPPEGDFAFRGDPGDAKWPEMVYGGALSFLRRRYSRDLTGVDVAVSGIPFDSATSNRSGARLGPRAVRAASSMVAELDAFPWGFDPFSLLEVVDYGDCQFDFGYQHHAVEVIEAHADAILATGTTMLTIGGDHFVTYPLLRAHAKVHGPLALVHFDAHSDTWDDDGERLDHGSMFLRAANEGLIDPSRSVQIGIRTHNDHTHGFTILDAPWIHQHGPAATVAEIRRVVGDHPAYLTFDIDCLDPAFAPGTGTPVPGGLSTAEALQILRSLGGLELRGFDVVEVAPAYDHAEITALAAATIGHDMLCLLAEARR